MCEGEARAEIEVDDDLCLSKRKVHYFVMCWCLHKAVRHSLSHSYWWESDMVTYFPFRLSTKDIYYYYFQFHFNHLEFFSPGPWTFAIQTRGKSQMWLGLHDSVRTYYKAILLPSIIYASFT